MLNRVEGAREGPLLAPPGAPKRGGCPGDRAFGAVGMEIKAAPGRPGTWGAVVSRAYLPTFHAQPRRGSARGARTGAVMVA